MENTVLLGGETGDKCRRPHREPDRPSFASIDPQQLGLGYRIHGHSGKLG